ncbi:MAG TPA: Type 1 glutamine amidotransferase-like domain-containing protein [Thermoanaerobaculia bacterium]|jgi:cyanophycinase-like exopeptidase|nr:Type 1 glutamine amidotransferase-like domain-containing protein [Thermoanaerobaculia bacterium]
MNDDSVLGTPETEDSASRFLIRHSTFQGVLALVGGGEFSFGETAEADQAWLDETPEGSTIGFVPAASGSEDYGRHFAEYLQEEFERTAETIPIYRGRDGRRGKNAERIRDVGAVYLGGGVADHLLDAIVGTPSAEALAAKLQSGGVVVAIAAAAQAVGAYVRSIAGGALIPGLGWLPEGVVEPNFDPGHDRRLRKLLEAAGVTWGLGIPSGAAVLLGPEGVELVGTVYFVRGAKGEIEILS